MTGGLIRNRVRVARHSLRALETSEKARLLIVVALVVFLLVRWVLALVDVPTGVTDPAEIRSIIRVTAYRVGGFLAAWIGFSSFGPLWRSTENEVLNRFPVDPRAIFGYRLAMALVANAPFLGLGLLGFAPLLWGGEVARGIEAILYLSALYLFSVIWSTYWHMFAAYSVVTPEYARIKGMLAGKMVLPERTLLLYSPFLGASCGFLAGLLVLVGASMISRDWLTTGIALVLAPVPPTVWAFYRTRARFEDWYYLALAALADGDVLGEISESAPTSSYFGISFVDRLPVRIRPLVAKDLRQAWRRSRLEHIVLLMGAVAFMPMARRRGADLLEEGWLWPLIWLIVLAASTPAFRMTRAPSDAPWHWLSLPVSLTRQYFARWAAVAFFVLLVAPFLAVGARWSGQGWAISLGGVGLVCVGASWIATNLALFFFGPSRWGVALLAGMTVGALVLGRGDPLEAGGWLFVAATFSAVPLRSLASRMAAAEHRG